MGEPQPNSEKGAPLYKRIEASLRERIRDGSLPPRSMLPSRRELAREYGVALPTIERAIAILISDGTLRADDRRGTFVADSAAPTPGRYSTAPARVCQCGATIRRPSDAPLTLGVITTVAAETDAGQLDRLWTTAIISSLESTFLGEGASSRFIDRNLPDGTLMPIEYAATALVEGGADALAVVNDCGPQDDTIAALERAGLPFVIITEDEVRRPVASVMLDNHSAGYQAAMHLLQAGHQEILFLAPFTAPCIEERIAGVRDALGNAGLTSRALRVYPNNPPSLQSVTASLGWDGCTEAGRNAASRAIAEDMVPSAMIAANDYAAYGVYRAAAESGKTVGHDFVLVGFDDHPNSRFLGLTTLRPPLEAMGREAGRLLLAALQGEEYYGQVRLRPLLLRRTSTCSFQCQRAPGEMACWPARDLAALVAGAATEQAP